MPRSDNMSCWIITEGMAGTENQCLGVAEALGVEADVRRMSLRQPWRTFSPWLGFEQPWSFTEAVDPPWPDLLLTSGRKSAAASRYIKKASNGKTFTVHLQDPRINPAHFDLLAVPAHDPARGANVITTTAAPNRITDLKLELARGQFKEFQQIKSPRVAVLIGGNSKAYRITPDLMTILCEQLKSLEAGLMITTSRRTGKDLQGLLAKALDIHPLPAPLRSASLSLQGEGLRERIGENFFWNNEGENPYSAMLAWADYILVTADSVSMLSDAATTGKPVYLIDLQGGGKRLDALHGNLMKAGALRKFEGRLENWSYPALRDAEIIAAEIRKRLNSRAGL